MTADDSNGTAGTGSEAPHDAPETAPDTTLDGTAGPAPATKLDEIRAVDALTRPAALQAELSMEDIAQLDAWFGRPSMLELEEKGEVQFDFFGRPIDPEARQRREAARQRALEAVDPAMLRLAERHIEAGDHLIVFRPSLDVHIDPARFERDLITISSPEIGEVERPGDLEKHLRETTPQALLRDLHRPVDEFSIEYERPDAAEADIDPFFESRAAIAGRYGYAPQVPALAQARDALRPVSDAKASDWSQVRTPRRRVLE